MGGREGGREEGRRQEPHTSKTQKVPGHNVIRYQVIGLGGGGQDVPGRDEGRQEGVNDRPNEEGHIECLSTRLKRGGREGGGDQAGREAPKQEFSRLNRGVGRAKSASWTCTAAVAVWGGWTNELGWVLGV